MPRCKLPTLTARVVSKIHKCKRKSLEFANFRVNVLRLRLRLRLCFSLWTVPFNSIGTRFCVYVAFALTIHCEWAFSLCQSTAVCRMLTFIGIVRAPPRPCLQNQNNVPGTKLKWHYVVVHNNVFRDSVKHLMVQNPNILHGNAKTHIAAAVTDLLHRS